MSTMSQGGIAAMTAAMLAAAGLAAAQEQKTPSWTETIAVHGDLRFRAEWIEQEGKEDRQRDRIRLRLGADAACNDRVKVGVQLSTGQGDPTSANQTLTGGFSRKDVKLSLAYVDWALLPGLDLIAGKIEKPFLTTQEIIWDSDLNPEGLALRGARTLGPVDVTGSASYLWVTERAGEGDDTRLYAGQLAANWAFAKDAHWRIGGTCYQYDRIEGVDVLDWEGKNNSYGNSTVPGTVSGAITNRAYATGFTEMEGFMELGFRVWVPVTFYGSYVENTEADSDNRAFLYGAAAGSAAKPGGCEVGYDFRRVEKDAVVGAFPNSTAWGDGANGKGHRVYGKAQILKNLLLCASYFMSYREIDRSEPVDYHRLQIDLMAKF